MDRNGVDGFGQGKFQVDCFVIVVCVVFWVLVFDIKWLVWYDIVGGIVVYECCYVDEGFERGVGLVQGVYCVIELVFFVGLFVDYGNNCFVWDYVD